MKKLYVYFFMASVSVYCDAWAFSSCGEWGCVSLGVQGSPCDGSFYWGAWVPEHKLSGCGVSLLSLQHVAPSQTRD